MRSLLDNSRRRTLSEFPLYPRNVNLRNKEYQHIRLSDLNLLELGNTIQVAGVVYANEKSTFVCMLPDESFDDQELLVLDLSHEEWKLVLQQTDYMETEILSRAVDKTLTKAIIRKSTRLVEQGVSWHVYRRDKYKCRYCGADKVPLTVDHLVLWEEGGPSIEENLVTACRKCNKVRGRTPYNEWMAHPFYAERSKNLTEAERAENICLMATIDCIPRVYHQKSR
jgi:hypothetical protein